MTPDQIAYAIEELSQSAPAAPDRPAADQFSMLGRIFDGLGVLPQAVILVLAEVIDELVADARGRQTPV